MINQTNKKTHSNWIFFHGFNLLVGLVFFLYVFYKSIALIGNEPLYSFKFFILLLSGYISFKMIGIIIAVQIFWIVKFLGAGGIFNSNAYSNQNFPVQTKAKSSSDSL